MEVSILYGEPQDTMKINTASEVGMKVLTSRKYRISDAIGTITYLKKRATNVGEVDISKGGTDDLILNRIYPGITIVIFSEVINHH